MLSTTEYECGKDLMNRTIREIMDIVINLKLRQTSFSSELLELRTLLQPSSRLLLMRAA